MLATDDRVRLAFCAALGMTGSRTGLRASVKCIYPSMLGPRRQRDPEPGSATLMCETPSTNGRARRRAEAGQLAAGFNDPSTDKQPPCTISPILNEVRNMS